MRFGTGLSFALAALLFQTAFVENANAASRLSCGGSAISDAKAKIEYDSKAAIDQLDHVLAYTIKNPRSMEPGICLVVGTYNEVFNHTADDISALLDAQASAGLQQDQRASDLGNQLMNQNMRMTGFCGPADPSFVPQGDRIKLLEAVAEIRATLRQIQDFAAR